MTLLTVDSSDSVKLKVQKGPLKETKKRKLAETVSKRISKKLKHGVTVKKCRKELSDLETLSLLSPGKSLGDVRRKKKATRRSSISFGDNSVQYFDNKDPVTAVESSSDSPHVNTSSESKHASDTTSDGSVVFSTASVASDSSPSISLSSRMNKPLLIPKYRVDEKRKQQMEARRLRRQRSKVSKINDKIPLRSPGPPLLGL